jgi:hypothetical protein
LPEIALKIGNTRTVAPSATRAVRRSEIDAEIAGECHGQELVKSGGRESRLEAYRQFGGNSKDGQTTPTANSYCSSMIGHS